MNITKGNFFTITSSPTEKSETVVIEFQYWIEGVKYTNGEQMWNKLTETTKGIRMLLLLAFACVLFCMVCCVTSISVSEKKDRASKNVKGAKFSNAVGPVTLDLDIDPYHPMTEGETSKRSESYVTPPKR